jgi:serine phosphatase RsbU (regulator of sigma subunit)
VSRRTSEPGVLRRLLKRSACDALLADARALAPGGRLALVDTVGTVFAGDSGDSRDDGWLPAIGARSWEALDDALDRVSLTPSVDLYSLRSHDRVIGALAVRQPVPTSVVTLLRRGLDMVLERAADARDLGQETLDRYREINVLYRLNETIGASLDADEIPALLLNESRRAIPVDAGAVVLSPDEPRVAAGFGSTGNVGALVTRAQSMLRAVFETGLPRIESEPAANGLLCVPIGSQAETLGAVLLSRDAGRPPFTAGDEKLLTAIAAEGGVAYDRARLLDERVRRERLDQELQIGRRIQLSLLPASAPERDGWEFGAVYRAARHVGGDFYDFIERPEANNVIDVVIGDVTGKGVPAALVMASTRAVLRASAGANATPSGVLVNTNAQLVRDGRSGLFVTALYGSLDLARGTFTFASGGHDAPLLVRGGSRRTRLLDSPSTILGIFERIDLEDRTVRLERGDAVVLYTDGVTEARDRRRQLFGERRLRSVVKRLAAEAGQRIAEGILEEVGRFADGVEAADDITVVVIRRSGDDASQP